jgi:hypothetical protein
LLQAADSSYTPEPHLSVKQKASAWVGEGLHGDRVNAVSQLEDLLTSYPSGEDSVTIVTALAEVASFPPQGGMSAVGNSVNARIAQVQRSASFIKTLIGQQASPADQELAGGSTVPCGFALSSAVPNPFNPITTLKLEVIESGAFHVRLYNLRGQLVQDLLNENLSEGMHSIRVDGGTLASGTYFVEATGSKGTQTVKLLLVK